MPPRDVFLVLRYGHEDRVVDGTFAEVTASLGKRLRPVLPWTEWASVDGDLSLLRIPSVDEAVHRG